ncbi:MAG: phosphatase PAP2 family protein [Chthoniobacterales bacterium]
MPRRKSNDEPEQTAPRVKKAPSPPRSSVWIALGVLLLALLLSFRFDLAVDQWVAGHRDLFWEGTAKACSRYFAWHFLILGAVGAGVIAWWRARRDLVRIFCVMIVAASVAGLSADILRGVLGRTRPSAKVTQGWYGPRSGSEWLIGKHAYNSFPSGHTTAATGFALPLFFWRRRWGWVAVPFIAAVAAARVYLGAHHLSDVLAGMLLGALLASWIWRRFTARSWAAEPA